jgi:hypothetical protein
MLALEKVGNQPLAALAISAMFATARPDLQFTVPIDGLAMSDPFGVPHRLQCWVPRRP